MKYFHIHISVDDLAKSIGFYSTLFGTKPTRIEADYAKWMLEDPRMNFAISTGRQPVGVNHLGFQVDSADELEGMHWQLADAQARLIQESGQACCYAKSDKYWVTDPTGIAWETFHTLGSILVYGEDTPVFNHGSSTVPARGEGPAAQAGCCAVMPNDSIVRRLLAEGLGSTLLAATVVGSGVMAERFSGGNTGIALLANMAATVAVLATLIALMGPISGAHFNPAVSVIEAKRGRLVWRDAGLYSLVQTLGCCAGSSLAHLMFELPLWQLSAHVRTGAAQWVGEGVATFGLLLVVIGHRRSEDAPWMVAAWLGAAYWFTASTSFANPAITIARSLTNTFSGIRPIDVPCFILAQFIGAVVALEVARVLFPVGAAKPEVLHA